MKRFAWSVVLALSVLTTRAAPASAQTLADSAASAWTGGRTEDALRLYTRIAAADSANTRALHRIALIHAWNGRYAESLALFDRLLRIEPSNIEARLDRTRVLAWSGRTRAAIVGIDSIIARDPRNIDALQARAQFLSWEGSLREALQSYDRILEISPDSRTTRIDRARVLQWSEQFKSATAVYDSLLQRDPNDREALLGLANVLALSSRHDSARAIYATLVQSNPSDIDALRGEARVATWQGRLYEGELLWLGAMQRAPRDAGTMAGYAQVLRWQGRDAAALDVLRRARSISPSNAEIREQLRWVELAVSPRSTQNATYESDSDGNRIATLAVTAAFRAAPRAELRADAYARGAGNTNITRNDHTIGATSYGAMVGAWLQLEPGWAGTIAVGGSRGSGETTAQSFAAYRASVSTPGRHAYGATASYSHSALDGSATLIDRQVYTDELAIEAHTMAGRVNLVAAVGTTSFTGRISDATSHRWNVLGVVGAPIARGVTLGLRTRAFGFDEDLDDGYFDPDFYGLAELTGRFVRESPRWSLSLEGAPGVQQVRKGSDPTASFRVGTRAGYNVARGRTIAVNAIYAKSGMQQLSPTAGADYRYIAFGISGSWVF